MLVGKIARRNSISQITPRGEFDVTKSQIPN